MLFLNPEVGAPVRAQGVLVTDQEIERVIAFWQKMSPQPGAETPPWETLLTEAEDGEDGLVEQAIEIVRSTQRASASLLQRRLKIGYPRAARLLGRLEEMGIVGPRRAADANAKCWSSAKPAMTRRTKRGSALRVTASPLLLGESGIQSRKPIPGEFVSVDIQNILEAVLVTVYRPDPDRWKDWRIRRKKQ